MGLKKNVIYSSILTVTGYIFPFLTFPYVTRILGVERFGLCSFYDSIITYFILFSMLGMSTLGIREIAKCNGDKERLSKTYSSLFVLNLLSTIISISALLCSLLFVDKFRDNYQMIIIGCVKVLSNFLLIEWFYRGCENFKFITVRTLIVRSLYVVLVFLLVRKPDDYILYFLLTALMFAVNAVINVIYSRKLVKFTLRGLELKVYVKPFIIFGAYQILTSMYTSFNVAYLGFVTDEVEVGYYSSSVKLFNILLSFYTAFTGVLLPRMSSLASDGDNAGFKRLLEKSFNILLFFAIPIIVISEIYAPEIISVMAGGAFYNSIIPMRIVMPLVLIIGIEQILVFQVLMPLNNDKKVFLNSIIGASIGVLSNIILVKSLGSTGSALTWLLSEIAVLSASVIFTRDAMKGIGIIGIIIRKVLYAVPIAGILIIFRHSFTGVISFCIACIFLFLYYFIIEMYIEKDSDLKAMLHNIVKK